MTAESMQQYLAHRRREAEERMEAAKANIGKPGWEEKLLAAGRYWLQQQKYLPK